MSGAYIPGGVSGVEKSLVRSSLQDAVLVGQILREGLSARMQFYAGRRCIILRHLPAAAEEGAGLGLAKGRTQKLFFGTADMVMAQRGVANGGFAVTNAVPFVTQMAGLVRAIGAGAASAASIRAGRDTKGQLPALLSGFSPGRLQTVMDVQGMPVSLRVGVKQHVCRGLILQQLWRVQGATARRDRRQAGDVIRSALFTESSGTVAPRAAQNRFPRTR